MEVSGLLEYLGEQYDESKLLPVDTMYSSENRKYLLNELGEDKFRNYRPTDLKNDFRVIAVDGGSITLFDTAYWGLGFIKLRARFIDFNVKRKEGRTVETAGRENFVLFLPEDGGGEGIVKRKFYEKGNYLKREEMRFVREILREKNVDEEDLLLIDGSLGMQSFYEKEMIKMHKNIIGVSKRSGLRINKYPVSSYLTMQVREYSKDKEPWYCYPMIREYPGEAVAEMMFCSFTPNARYSFRVDFPSEHLNVMNLDEQHKFIEKQLSKIALFSFDPKYRGYPYPLGAVHSDAVMRPIDKDRARKFVEGKLDELGISGEALGLIKKDIENEYWYDRFRKGA